MSPLYFLKKKMFNYRKGKWVDRDKEVYKEVTKIKQTNINRQTEEKYDE